MKKWIALFLVVSLCLTACGDKLTLDPRTHGDLTIGIPEDFIDLSQEDFAAGLDFIYGLDPMAVNGLREEKAVLAAYGLDLDLQRYGELVIKGNNVESALSQRDGILTFTYEANGYTYLVTLWETEAAFWTVQAYCPTADYARVQDQMWQILSSVTV